MKKVLIAIAVLMTLVLCLPLSTLATEVSTTADTVVEAVVDTTAETVADTTAETTPDSETAADDAPKTNFGFYPSTLTETLPIMGMGMLGIFLVIGVIVLVVLALGAISKKVDKQDE